MTETPDIKVRLAGDDEAHIVENIVSEIFDMGAWKPTFDRVFPDWLVAEVAGKGIVGVINIRLSNPFSSVEMMSFEPGLDRNIRTRAGSLLIDSANTICAANGSVGISSMIPDSMPGYLKVAQRRGYVAGNHGTIMFGRLR